MWTSFIARNERHLIGYLPRHVIDFMNEKRRSLNDLNVRALRLAD